MKPSIATRPLFILVCVGTFGCCALGVAAAASMRSSTSESEKEVDELLASMKERDRLIKEWSSEVASLHSRQSEMIKWNHPSETTRPEISCDDIRPRYQYGSGILQVASVLGDRGDVELFGDYQQKRLKQLLSERGVEEWTSHLSDYKGRGKGTPIYRIIFNNIGPEGGAQMCEWLRCENWTGGCAFIDEKGKNQLENPVEYEKPIFFEPSEDLYQNWLLAMKN